RCRPAAARLPVRRLPGDGPARERLRDHARGLGGLGAAAPGVRVAQAADSGLESMKPESSRAVENAAERRRFEEQVAWKEVDQLHAATLQFTAKCLELKKLCVALSAALLAWRCGAEVRLFADSAVLALGLIVCF